MNNIEVMFEVSPFETGSDIVIAILSENEFNSFEKKENVIKAYIGKDSFDKINLDNISKELTSYGLNVNYIVDEIEPKNWNQIWEQNFQPIQIGNDCYVRAPFHKKKDSVIYDIVISPKMAFGTGHHETTAMVLEFMLEMKLTNMNIADIGCGSGILSILAEMKGGNKIIAIDNDVNSWQNTIDNAKINNCSKIVSLHGDISLLGEEKHDVILANINRNVLIEYMGEFAYHTTEGGILVLSGFYSQDVDIILSHAEKHGYKYDEKRVVNNWNALRLIKVI